MLATLLDTFATLGAYLAGITAFLVAVATFLKVLTSTEIGRPLKWVWNQLVGEPVGGWFKGAIAEQINPVAEGQAAIASEIRFNGGSTMKDAVHRIDDHLIAHINQEDKDRVVIFNLLAEHSIMLGAMVKSQPLPIFKTDAEGSLVYANPAALSLIGMTSTEAAGQGWAKAIHPDDRTRVVETWLDATKKRVEYGPVYYRYVHPSDGKVTCVEAIGTPIQDADGNITSWIATVVRVDDNKLPI